jgi:hypothetical protein
MGAQAVVEEVGQFGRRRLCSGDAVEGAEREVEELGQGQRELALGSLSPVGIAPTPNIPVSVSSLSASAAACATGPSGNASPANRGQ